MPNYLWSYLNLMSTVRETAVGLFVLFGLVCVAYLTIKLGKMEVFSQQGFELSANFDSVSGLRVGADVEMAGVPVGRVISIGLDQTMPMRGCGTACSFFLHRAVLTGLARK